MNARLEYCEGRGFIAEVIRTSRIKTASVRVEEGKVSVVVPFNLPNDKITKVVTDKTRWIKEKIYLQQQYKPSRLKEYVNGESFAYLGRNYRLKLIVGKKQSVKLKNGRLVVALPEHQQTNIKINQAITGWYRHHAIQRLNDKVKRYASIIGVTPESINIRTFKSRWGSCHANGNILFNWKVIIAPNPIVDYVVVHELCHLKQHDHSPKFWKLVERVLPDYLDSKEWLKVNGQDLEV